MIINKNEQKEIRFDDVDHLFDDAITLHQDQADVKTEIRKPIRSYKPRLLIVYRDEKQNW
ncbi:MAG: hypothetical protein KJO29_13040 [Bacteroidia bacterium]|nr:hypothetical protein [Bacteroidia bacterium]